MSDKNLVTLIGLILVFHFFFAFIASKELRETPHKSHIARLFMHVFIWLAPFVGSFVVRAKLNSLGIGQVPPDSQGSQWSSDMFDSGGDDD